MPTRLLSLWLRFQSAGAWILHIVVNVTWLSPELALIRLLVIIGYIILLVILIPIHRSLLRLLHKRREVLTWEYDTLRYLIAKAQKQSGVDANNKWITALFDLKHPDYLHHHTEIKGEIFNIETSLWTKIIEDTKRAEIEQRQQKYKKLTMIVDIYGRFVSVITVLVYKLFW